MANILAKVTVLYVEANEELRKELITILQSVLKKVYICTDGIEAFYLYEKKKESIDLVLANVNIPGINGVDLLKKIRAIDKDLPFMINTIHTQTELLLEAIEYDVTEYIPKSISTKELLLKIANRCHDRFSYIKVAMQELEMTRYLEALNKVAIVSKTDLRGYITYVNEIFCEVAQYEESELLGKPHNVIRHPDMPKASFEDMWKTIQSGNKWQGKVKNKAKDGSPYFVNATIFPQYDIRGKDIVGYIAIRFLTTDDENEKREFKKKVIVNLQDSRKKQLELRTQNNTLESELTQVSEQIKEYEKYIINLQTSLKECEDKNIIKERQLNHYEMQMNNVDESYFEKMKMKRNEVKDRLDNMQDLKKEKEQLLQKNKELDIEMNELKSSILNSKEKDESQRKRIRDLSDIVNDLEKKLRAVDD
ncbi:response regulator [Poseidonibacter ostreae]|jgi:PAS domain S-box-containing protein|uniref:Response regulator n=1 Tax=Poseidonibacter ostreae TaxID=2654171 RepID=A0A6L4WUK7_9BACT|nr:response regulator [Poseidonibacter ostreae]KAB7884699.1 response regulator [Poseidonibacter ostreae]KAB7889952.1 response regulator [Poseidonibacter ostreae]KAB7891466.1 response regulator [Poseidonibacter ostreae]